jgi:hypothetical protein
MRLTTEQQFKDNIGRSVTVSDGAKEPPKHHTKKHSAWRRRNFTGVIYSANDLGVEVMRPESTDYIKMVSHFQWHTVQEINFNA